MELFKNSNINHQATFTDADDFSDIQLIININGISIKISTEIDISEKVITLYHSNQMYIKRSPDGIEIGCIYIEMTKSEIDFLWDICQLWYHDRIFCLWWAHINNMDDKSNSIYVVYEGRLNFSIGYNYNDDYDDIYIQWSELENINVDDIVEDYFNISEHESEIFKKELTMFLDGVESEYITTNDRLNIFFKYFDKKYLKSSAKSAQNI